MSGYCRLESMVRDCTYIDVEDSAEHFLQLVGILLGGSRLGGVEYCTGRSSFHGLVHEGCKHLDTPVTLQ